MKIEVGKYYETRGGRKVGPMGLWNGYFDADMDQADLFESLWAHDGVNYPP